MIRIVSADTCEAAPEAALSYPAETCADCIRHDGLCRKHVPSVCPTLAQPFWYRHAHSGMYRELKDEKDHSREGLAIKRRKERRRAKRYEQLKQALNTNSPPNRGLFVFPSGDPPCPVSR